MVLYFIIRKTSCTIYLLLATVVMPGGQAWRWARLLVALLVAPLALRSDGPPGESPAQTSVSANDGGAFGDVPV